MDQTPRQRPRRVQDASWGCFYQNLPRKKTGIGAPWAEERRKGPARVPQALHFMTAERNLQKIQKKENPVIKNKSIQSRETGKGLLQKSQM